MPIKEKSFRIGCGRYIQAPGCIDEIGDEILRPGFSPLVIGGRTALGIIRSQPEKSISQKCNTYEFTVHAGTCKGERAKENEYYTRICRSSAVNGSDEVECAKFKESLKYLWSLK